MRCDEVQSHFSDYLDEASEGPRAKGIETHLTNCPICSEEFAGLLQCRHLVASLPEVEPPVGFTMRVMANVTEIATQTSLWKRLLAPLRMSIPLQATAVVLVGVLSLYIYQKADYEIAPQAPAPQELKREEPTATVANQPQKHAATPVEETVTERRSETKPATVERQARTSGPAPVQTIAENPPEGNAGIRRNLPIQVQGVVAGVAGPIRMPRQPPFRLMPSQQEWVNLGEPMADYELLVKSPGRPSQPPEAPGNSAENGARPESVPSAMQGSRLIGSDPSSVLKVLWFTVPQDQYDQFKSELATQARIESEVPLGIRDRAFSFRSDGPLLIKVVVLAPTE